LCTFYIIQVATLTGANPAFATQIAKPSSHDGDVILVLGGFSVFTGGLGVMASSLAKHDVESKIYRHTQSRKIATSIIANQRKYGRKPIVLIGHSYGANTVIKVARILQKENLEVRYMVTIAATNPDAAPPNVQTLTNYYFRNGWGKLVPTEPGFSGQLNNIDMSKTAGANHFNVDENRELHQEVIDNVLRFVRTDNRS
jgi:hypothetical protein